MEVIKILHLIVFLHFFITAPVPEVVSAPGGLNAETLSKLKELLRSVRRPDKDLKMRLAALQWGVALFPWDIFVIETAYLLAGEPAVLLLCCAVIVFFLYNCCFCAYR
jgi:hypothetical protein